jgi:hypothetical protein
MGSSVNTITDSTPLGAYKLNKDLIGYKRIECYNIDKKHYKFYTAEVKINTGARVIKDKQHYSNIPNLRTDDYTLTNIFHNGDNITDCRSIYASEFRYEINRKYQQPNLNYINGLHFHLTKEDADNYL